MKHPERIEDYLEHIAEAIARATDYLQHTGDLAAFQRDHRTLNFRGRKCVPCATS
jgi:hypothetical protein